MIGIKDQCFGVEIELTGITRAEAAEALAAYFETTPQRSYDNYDSWYVPDREGKQWRIMSDGSIRAEWNDDGHYRRTTDPEYRVEMVTPKLTYDEMEKFQECVRRIRQAGGKVNDSCGMHVHVDASNHNRQSLKNLLSIMYSKEDLLLSPENGPRPCQPLVSARARTHAAAGTAAVQRTNDRSYPVGEHLVRRLHFCA